MSEPAGAAAGTRLPVVLLWHMHQPQYRDALSGEYVLPWTYLHALKDYSDMAAHLEEVPGARAVVNFVPVLIEQLEDYAERVRRHLAHGDALGDAVLATLSEAPLPATPVARMELARALLRAQVTRMIEPHEPYAEAATLARSLCTHERSVWIADALLRDLAVWYHLVWLGEAVRRSEPLVERLMDKARGFDAADRRELLELVGRVLAEVLPRYRALARAGRVELSMTPYAHPILPLLLDFGTAREALPQAPLPAAAGYAGGAARCDWHLSEGRRLFEQTFGVSPRGCWPSEGAVSAAALALIDRHGFEWAATSANVLRGSLGAELAAQPDVWDAPYAMAGQKLVTFFRDDAISDLIGFEYATWHGDDAAEHLVGRLVELADRYAGQTDRCVLIALDGENAWEHYPYNGYYFLRRAYERLATHARLELTTLGDFLGRRPRARALQRVVAGSWVHGTLSTWMGDAAKNAGWDLLCAAKDVFDRVTTRGALDTERLQVAQRQLALCESSDWFWWFGDYNPAEAVGQFDRLYRRQLTNLYRVLGLEPPAALAHPISRGSSHGAPEHGGAMRRADGA